MLKFPRFVCLSVMTVTVCANTKTNTRQVMLCRLCKEWQNISREKNSCLTLKGYIYFSNPYPLVYTRAYITCTAGHSIVSGNYSFIAWQNSSAVCTVQFFSRCRHEQWTTDRKCGLTEGAVTCNTLISSPGWTWASDIVVSCYHIKNIFVRPTCFGLWSTNVDPD